MPNLQHLLFSLLLLSPAPAFTAGSPSSPVARQPGAAAPEELAYGKDTLQKLDFWKPATAGAPLVIFVHGGAWKLGDKRTALGEKGGHFLDQGWGFASLNYRLVPAHKVEEQAQDVADAVAFLIARADKLGFDAKRTVLMGHSAGAHLAALVGTDTSYLKKAGLEPAALRGIIPLDGAAYDVPRQITAGAAVMHDSYVQAFGTDPARQKSLSPTLQAAAPNAPAFLILHVQRLDGIAQSKALAEALRQAGTPVEIHDFPGFGLQGHMEINRKLGNPAYPATPVVDAWLKRVFAK